MRGVDRTISAGRRRCSSAAASSRSPPSSVFHRWPSDTSTAPITVAASSGTSTRPGYSSASRKNPRQLSWRIGAVVRAANPTGVRSWGMPWRSPPSPGGSSYGGAMPSRPGISERSSGSTSSRSISWVSTWSPTSTASSHPVAPAPMPSSRSSSVPTRCTCTCTPVASRKSDTMRRGSAELGTARLSSPSSTCLPRTPGPPMFSTSEFDEVPKPQPAAARNAVVLRRNSRRDVAIGAIVAAQAQRTRRSCPEPGAGWSTRTLSHSPQVSSAAPRAQPRRPPVGASCPRIPGRRRSERAAATGRARAAAALPGWGRAPRQLSARCS